MTDKAVSTEDLVFNIPARNASLEAARLEAVLKTLVDNKVEALKNKKRKSSSITSSPKSIINRLRITSMSSVSSKDKDETSTHSQTMKSANNRCQCEEIVVMSTTSSKRLPAGETGSRSPKSRRPEATAAPRVQDSDRTLHFNEGEGNENYGYVHKATCSDQQCQCTVMLDCSEACYCTRESNGEIHMHFDDDYISLKIEDDVDLEQVTSERAMKRVQRKKRRRRKRRMKAGRRMPLSNPVAIPVANEKYKVIDQDELSKRARWTIVITACLLMFMCLFLVGVTLRMAPIIDDMVRKENEELMNSLTGGDASSHQTSLQNLTASVPLNSK